MIVRLLTAIVALTLSAMAVGAEWPEHGLSFQLIGLAFIGINMVLHWRHHRRKERK